MRASCEKQLREGTDDPADVRVVVADGEDNEDVALKVSDEGGGIARSDLRKVWSYLYTTASKDVQARGFSEDASDFSGAPLAGLGYGLPISRAYARHATTERDTRPARAAGNLDPSLGFCRGDAAAATRTVRAIGREFRLPASRLLKRPAPPRPTPESVSWRGQHSNAAKVSGDGARPAGTSAAT